MLDCEGEDAVRTDLAVERSRDRVSKPPFFVPQNKQLPFAVQAQPHCRGSFLGCLEFGFIEKKMNLCMIHYLCLLYDTL